MARPDSAWTPTDQRIFYQGGLIIRHLAPTVLHVGTGGMVDMISDTASTLFVMFRTWLYLLRAAYHLIPALISLSVDNAARDKN